VRVAKLPMNLVGRMLTLGETEGFMKAIVAAEDDAILALAANRYVTGQTLVIDSGLVQS
jgi:pyruvate/2-oxoglutarate dehydrogenase complex dihydrolipoamide dehydrogenase (E3) component